MIAEIGRREELDLGVIGGHLVGVHPDPAHQHAGEEEVGEHHDAAEAQAHHVAQAGFHQGEGDAGIDGFPPAEAEPLHQHPGDLGHIRVGIRIGGAAPHHHQQRFRQRHSRRRLQGLPNPGAGGGDHQPVHPQLPSVVDRQVPLGAVGVQHRGDVVFGVARSEEHRRHGEHPLHALFP